MDGEVRDVAGPSGTCDKEVRAVCVHYYTAYPLTFFRPQKIMQIYSLLTSVCPLITYFMIACLLQNCESPEDLDNIFHVLSAKSRRVSL